MSRPLTVLTVLKQGGDYNPSHVGVVRAMAREHLPPHEFLCLTDHPAMVPWKTASLRRNLPKWWSKLELFALPVDGPMLFLDLDTVLRTGASQAVDAAAGHPLVVLRDVYRGQADPAAVQSSMMYWEKPFPQFLDRFTLPDTARFHSDQEWMEHIIRDEGIATTFWQDITDCMGSFKAHVQPSQDADSKSIVVFHGRPRPWEQSLVPYVPPAGCRCVSGWMMPVDDLCGGPSSIRESPAVARIIALLDRKRTVIQAGGNVGVWPHLFSKEFERVLSFEPNVKNWRAAKLNLGDALPIMHAALSDRHGTVGFVEVPGNHGAGHIDLSGTMVQTITIDSLGITDCDLIQLDIEGAEHLALVGARRTIETSRPLIVIESKGLGRRHGFKDRDTAAMLESWGYRRALSVGRDIVWKYSEAHAMIAVQESSAPVGLDQSCVLVGNGPSVAGAGMGRVIDGFDNIIRFNRAHVRGFEQDVGTRTTHWATFGKGALPGDDDLRPDKIIFIHGDNGEPAYQPREIWRIPLSFYWSIMEQWNKDNTEKTLPSSGFLVAAWLIHCGVKRIHLAGFDHFAKHASSRQHHYWVKRSFKTPREHAGSFEAEQFANWVSEGRAFYLT